MRQGKRREHIRKALRWCGNSSGMVFGRVLAAIHLRELHTKFVNANVVHLEPAVCVAAVAFSRPPWEQQPTSSCRARQYD